MIFDAATHAEQLFNQKVLLNGEHFVTMELSRIPAQSLQLRLTSQDDPLFLYSSKIDLSDFERIKQEQSLLIDFSAFPRTMLELLNGCVERRFQLELNKRNDTLDIVEINSFKHLVHLCVPISAGGDDAIKAHMADTIRKLKDSLDKQKRSGEAVIAELKLSLNACQKTLDDRTDRIRCLEIEHESGVRSLIQSHDDELAREKQKMSELQSLFSSRLEAERTDLDRLNRDQIRVLNERIEKLENEKVGLETQLRVKETNERELSARLCVMNDEMVNVRRRSRLEDEEQRSVLDRTLNEEKRRYERLLNEMELKMKMEREEIDNEKERVLNGLKDKSGEIKSLRTNVRNLTLELNKANEIIKRLYDEALKTKKKTSTNRDEACQTPDKFRKTQVSFKDAGYSKPIKRWPDVNVARNG